MLGVMPTLRDIVVQRLEELGVSAIQAAESWSGMKREFIYDIVTEKKASVRSDKLADLAKALFLDPAALASGRMIRIPVDPDYPGYLPAASDAKLQEELNRADQEALDGGFDIVYPAQTRALRESAGNTAGETTLNVGRRTRRQVRAGRDVEGFDPIRLGKMPIRGEVAAGRWLETAAFLDWSEITNYVDGLAVPPGQEQFTYGLIVRGTSINKVALDGEILICLDMSSGTEAHEGDLVIVERVRDQGALREVTAKRLVRQDGLLMLRPESTDPMWQNVIHVEDDPQDDSEVRIIAKVKHVVRPV